MLAVRASRVASRDVDAFCIKGWSGVCLLSTVLLNSENVDLKLKTNVKVLATKKTTPRPGLRPEVVTPAGQHWSR